MDARHTTLSDVPFGATVMVSALLHPDDERVRLLELGLVPGAPVRLVRRAPFGCPVEVDIAGARFSFRRRMLDSILVVPRA
jgi:Fe2+ transport system protein FeoA